MFSCSSHFPPRLFADVIEFAVCFLLSLVNVFPRPKKVDFVDLLSFSFESEQI
jgi:hypothetical protein